MSNFAAWSPAAANFVQGVLYCVVLFASGGVTAYMALTTKNVMLSIVVFAVVLIAGLVVASIMSPSVESEDDEETSNTSGALGFSCAFFLFPVALLVSAYLVLAYLSQKQR